MGWLDEGMENLKQLLDSKISTHSGSQTPVCPFPFQHVSPSYGNSASVGVIGSRKSIEGLGNHQHRPSGGRLIERQPSWLDDLLNEPDPEVHRGHQRSVSDTFAYIGAAAKAFDMKEESFHENVTSQMSTHTQNRVNYKDSSQVECEIWPTPFEEKFKKDVNGAVSISAEKHDREEASSQNSEGSMKINCFSQVKPSASKSDAKRAKQQCAHRSRVRKLRYTAQLERSVQVLQAQGSEISAELEFVDHQNLILSMENRALKQRFDSLAQEQLIKQLEHEMLDREFGRLQSLYQLQRQQQMHMQQQQNSKNRRTKSRESNSIRGPITASAQT